MASSPEELLPAAGKGSPAEERILGTVRKAFKRYWMGGLEGEGRWWIGFSGGLDSTVLLHAAAQVGAEVVGDPRPQMVLGDTRDAQAERAGRRSPLAQLVAVHVHHGLHPDADAWERHCREVVSGLGVPFMVCRLDGDAVRGGPGRGEGSFETAARAARLAALRDIISPIDRLMLAHHQDDQAETVLLRILRGAGVAGAGAMRPKTRAAGIHIFRPFLTIPRAELATFAQTRGLSWVEDPTNEDPASDRNHIRHQVLPRLKERWPDASRTLAGFATRAQESAYLLNELATDDLNTASSSFSDRLCESAFISWTKPRQLNALRAWLMHHHGIAAPPRRWLHEILRQLVVAGQDRLPEARWNGIWVRRYRDELFTGRVREPPLRLPSAVQWRFDDSFSIALPHGSLEVFPAEEGEGVAADRLPSVVEVRFRRGGERCRPARRGVTRPLKHMMQELEVPPWERDERPLVFAGEQIVSVPGLFDCDPFAAREGEPAWRFEWEPSPTEPERGYFEHLRWQPSSSFDWEP